MTLGPSAVQERAVPTILAVIDATIALIDESGESEVRLVDVTGRSGVSNGSIMHHFGSRDGVISAALATRFDRAVVERIEQFDAIGEQLAGGPEPIVSLLLGSRDGQRVRARRARVRALSFARHRPDLGGVLAESLRTSERALADRLGSGVARGVITDGIPASALAVFSETYSLGLLLEDTLLVPIPSEEWETLLLAVLEAILAPAMMVRVRDEFASLATAAPGRLVTAQDERVAPEVPGAARPSLELSDDQRRVVAHAVGVLHEQGPDALSIVEACAATGVSRGWFARQIGSREGLIDLARLMTLLTAVEEEAAAYEQAFARATDGRTLAEELAGVVERSVVGGSRVDAWDRLDVVVAASRMPFARDAGAVIGWGLDRIGAAITDAQARGVVRSDVSARALARFLWSYPLAFLLGDVAGVPAPDMRALAVRTNATLGAA
jgi:AcrR family transcriptional regulator